MDKLESDSEDGLDVTTYEYRNDLMTSSKTTAEYYEIGSDGYITEKKGVTTTTGTTRSVRKKTTAHSASTPTIRKPMVRSWKIW